MSEPASLDVVVVGAGPAGSTTARHLAMLGYRVALFHRAGCQRGIPRWETISPIALELIRAYHPEAHTSLQTRLTPVTIHRLWSLIDLPKREAPSDRTILLDRNLLDEELRRSALAAGVTIVDSPIGSTKISHDGDVWEVVRTDHHRWRASFLVDGTGRRSVLNRCRSFLGAPTLAVETRWRGLSVPKWSTYLEAMSSAWLWAARDSGDLVLLTAFVSRDWLPGGKTQVVSRMRNLLEQSRLGLTSGDLKMELPTSVREATASSALDQIGASYLRVGDASLALDPIASQGCQQALISGFQGAAVAHTCLSSPSAYPLAEEFVLARLQETIALHVRHTREAYRQQSRFQTPFWSDRSMSDPSSLTPLEIGNRLAPNEAVPTEWIQLSPSIQICHAAALIGNIIKSVPAVWHPSWPRPVAFVGNRSAADLIKGLRGPISAINLVESWARRSGSTRESARALLNRLWQMGFFLSAHSPAMTRIDGTLSE
jgi:2-polyprenyl-6-methoxyphenol hydroxylase-like FAD-dependent oxidoreductase